MQKYHFYGSYTRNLIPILRAKDGGGLGRFNFYPKVSSNSKKNVRVLIKYLLRIEWFDVL